jgi:hypothetical protein
MNFSSRQFSSPSESRLAPQLIPKMGTPFVRMNTGDFLIGYYLLWESIKKETDLVKKKLGKG